MLLSKSLRRSCRCVAIEGFENRRLFAYTFVPLSGGTTNDDFTSTSISSINDAGTVAGQRYDNATVWTYNANTKEYDAKNLGFGGTANDIDSSGNFIVGNDSDKSRPFLYTKGKKILIDGVGKAKNGGYGGSLNAVNDSGVAVGTFSKSGSPERSIGFYTDKNGKPTEFKTPSGYTGVDLTGINNIGNIFGTAYNANGPHAFVYDKSGFDFVAAVKTGDGVTSFSTQGINSDGFVVVNTPEGVVYYNRPAPPNDGGHPGDTEVIVGVDMVARDMNDDYTVVGVIDPETNPQAMIDGDKLASIVKISGWDLQYANGINNKGWITGLAQGGNNNELTPYVLIKTPDTYTLSGQLFNDSDADGKKDAQEVGSGKRTVFLDTDGDGTLDKGEKSTTSNSNGDYSFSGLKAGTYKVSRVFPKGYSLSNGDGKKYVAATITDSSVSGVRLGSRTGTAPSTGSISGVVFNDTDKDGNRDKNESVSGKRTVFLDTNGNRKLDKGETSVASNSNGQYTFSGLIAGTYRVGRVFSSGYKLSNNSVGYLTLKLAAGQNVTGANLGSRMA